MQGSLNPLLDFGARVGTSTQLGIGVLSSMFNSVFFVIQNVMPYLIGVVVLAIIIGVAWRIIRHASGH